MKNKLKKNNRIIFAFICGFLISGITVYAATILSSSEVFYDNSKSGSSSNNVQGAIEELYKKSSNGTTGSCSLTKSNFYVGYTYNQTSGAANYCVTGDEATCTRTDCYTSSNKICPAGTIIDYIVSGTNTRVRFHVIKDKGKTMTMQSQKNTIGNTTWGPTGSNQSGPSVALPKLESATSSWTNVEDQTYTMGTTIFAGDNANSGCLGQSDFTTICDKNSYTWEAKAAKVRMITMQEVSSLGCKNGNTTNSGSCPIWMYNYLYQSTSYGGTMDDNNKSGTTYLWGYWTMSAYSPSTSYAWIVDRYGWSYYNSSSYSGTTPYCARAVIEVSK